MRQQADCQLKRNEKDAAKDACITETSRDDYISSVSLSPGFLLNGGQLITISGDRRVKHLGLMAVPEKDLTHKVTHFIVALLEEHKY